MPVTIQQIPISFVGDIKVMDGLLVRNNSWDSLKKGLLACLMAWAIGLVFIVVPYVNISVFMVFFPLGPFVFVLVYFGSRRSFKKLNGNVACPKCHKDFEIVEVNVAPPIYGQCPACRVSYEVLVNSRNAVRAS